MAWLGSSRQLGLVSNAFSFHDISLEGEQKERKPVQRRTVDASGSYVHLLTAQVHQRSPADAAGVQPTAAGAEQVLPPVSYAHQPAVNFNVCAAHASLSRAKAAVTCLTWTPEGRRCITGSQRGDFTLWGGTNFSFDTALQGHEAAIRGMVWTHNERYMLSVDDGGRIKYWRTNYELLKDEAAHQDAVCDVTVAPSDAKFSTCSKDGTVKVWDFATCAEERVMTGHGGDVTSAHWHPSQGLIASGSKDLLIKMWDARTGDALTTLHGHNEHVTSVQWNANGNWLLSASRDQTCKVWDLRMLKELGTYRGGHGRDVACAVWHPVHEELFSSGSHDGSLAYWLVSRADAQAQVSAAHDSGIWAMAWHPLGHMLATGSNDLTIRFWTQSKASAGRQRQQPGSTTAVAVPEGDGGRARPVTTALTKAIPGIS